MSRRTRTSAHSRDAVSFHRHAEYDGIETLRAHYVRQTFKPHGHDEYVIGVIERGVHDVWCRGEQRHADDGTVVTMNPGDIHHGGSGIPAGWTQRMIYVSEDVMRLLAEDITGRSAVPLPRFRAPFRIDDEDARLFSERHDAVHNPDLKLTRDIMLHDLVTSVIGRFASAPVDCHACDAPKRLTRARDYLHAHVDDEVPLMRLAAIAGVRKRQVINLFRRHIGSPPHAYHLALKVNKLKRLLRTGTPPAECAAAVGFVDQSHMTRHFHAVVGVTPKVYASAR